MGFVLVVRSGVCSKHESTYARTYTPCINIHVCAPMAFLLAFLWISFLILIRIHGIFLLDPTSSHGNEYEKQLGDDVDGFRTAHGPTLSSVEIKPEK